MGSRGGAARRRSRPRRAPSPAGPQKLRIDTSDGGASLDLGSAQGRHPSPWAAAHGAGVAHGRIAAPIFVSYATPNRRRYVEPLIERLRALGYTVWADWRDIATGAPFEAEIDQGLHTCTAMIAVLTPTSVDPGRWVRKEWERAVGTYFVPILPLMVEDCPYPAIFGPIQYLKTAPMPKHRAVARFRRADLVQLQQGIERLVLPVGRWVADETPAVGRVFVGRDKELRDLVGKLSYGVRVGLSRRASNAPVTVEGVGGMGKTMLVSELVRRIGPRFPGGVIFHSRAARTDPEEVMRNWALELGTELPAKVTPQWLRGELGKAGRLLVVIDDVWEDDYENVRVLCNEALPPGTERILTTRDSSLKAVIGGNWLRLERLKLQDGIALLENRLAGAGSQSIQATMERLWTILGGHALALEVAAGRCLGNPAFLEHQTDELEREIRHGRLSGVAMGLRTDDRDDSVLFCFDLSLKEIQEADGRDGTHLADRFAQLGVLAEEAPFDQRTAAAIWQTEPSEALKSLLSLARRGLVTSLPESTSFKLHPLIYAYALGLLKETPQLLKAAEARHLAHYVARLAEFEVGRWREFEVHAPNVARAGERAALLLPERLVQRFCRPARARAGAGSPRPAAQRAMDLALAAAPYVWHRRVHLGRRWLEAGLAAARLLRKPIAQASLLTHLGVWYNDRGDRRRAQAYFEEALKIWRRHATDEGRTGLAWALTNLGVLHRAIDEPQQAARYYREAIPIQEALKLRQGLAISLGCLGVLYRDLGQHDEAQRYCELSLAIDVELGDLNGQSIALNNIGRALRDQGKPQEARERLERALELAKKAGNETGVAIVLNNLGNVCFDLSEFDQALNYFRQTEPIREQTQDWARLAVTHHNIGEALRAQGRSAEALESFRKAGEIEERVDDVAGRASTLYSEASVLFESGRPEDRAEALNRLEEAQKILEGKKLELTSAGVPLGAIRRLATDWRAKRATLPRAARTI